jgi:hypothetical protein
MKVDPVTPFKFNGIIIKSFVKEIPTHEFKSKALDKPQDQVGRQLL